MFLKNLLFGDNSNKTDYKQAAYDKYYSDITNNTYDRAFGDMKDYLDKNYEGGSGKYRSDILTGLEDTAKNSLNNYNATKNDVFGNGLIGGLLNPIAQTMGGVSDLAGMGLSGGKYNAWDSSKDALGVHRDIGSDLGALGETALTVAPIAKGMSLAKAGKAVGAGTATAKQAAKFAASQAPKTLGQKVAGGALLGAGFGATGSLRDTGFENFDPGQFALSTAIGGGVGGGMAGLGSLLGKATAGKTAVTTGDAKPYQEALNNLKNSYTSPARYSDVVTNLPTVRGLDVARVTLDNLDDDTLKQLYKSSLKNVRSKAGANEATTAVKANRDLLQEMLRNGVPTTTTYQTTKAGSLGEALKNIRDNVKNTKTGTKVANLLKTKKGKVMAGAGSGLLLAQLLGGRKADSDNLSDADLQELYNYVYGGQ
jgi:hypothetical protein